MFSGNTDFDAQPLLSDGGLLMALYCTNLQVHLVAAMLFDTKLVSIGYIISNKLPPDTTQLLLWKQNQGCIFWVTFINIMLMKKVNSADTHREKARQASVPASVPASVNS